MATNFNPIELVVLQGNSLCNLNCTYCDLSAQSRRTHNVMSLDLVSKLFDELFRSGHMASQTAVVWHSGEPLTLTPSYYDDAIQRILQARDAIAPHVSVKFKIQTNGVLINEKWCRFFRRHQALLELGVSCDGPAHIHDAYRVHWNGHATHASTVRGMDLLQRYGIGYKVIAVVTRNTLAHAEAFFHFFCKRRDFLRGFHFNVLADAASPQPALSYSAGDRASYYQFYRRLLDLVHEASAEGADFKVMNFSQSLSRIMTAQIPGAPRYFQETSAPLKSISVDALGNLTTFYAGLSMEVLQDLYGDGKGLAIGNILEQPFTEMLEAEKLQHILHDFAVSAAACEESCPYFNVCPGGYEITKKLTLGTFAASETTECVIHVKTLIDALLDDLDEHMKSSGPAMATSHVSS